MFYTSFTSGLILSSFLYLLLVIVFFNFFKVLIGLGNLVNNCLNTISFNLLFLYSVLYSIFILYFILFDLVSLNIFIDNNSNIIEILFYLFIFTFTTSYVISFVYSRFYVFSIQILEWVIICFVFICKFILKFIHFIFLFLLFDISITFLFYIIISGVIYLLDLSNGIFYSTSITLTILLFFIFSISFFTFPIFYFIMDNFITILYNNYIPLIYAHIVTLLIYLNNSSILFYHDSSFFICTHVIHFHPGIDSLTIFNSLFSIISLFYVFLLSFITSIIILLIYVSVVICIYNGYSLISPGTDLILYNVIISIVLIIILIILNSLPLHVLSASLILSLLCLCLIFEVSINPLFNFVFKNVNKFYSYIIDNFFNGPNKS